jgi:hypothetical protein
MPDEVPCAWNNIPDPEERRRWDAAVQAGLRHHADKVADYSVAASPPSDTVEVRLTVPGSPPRYLSADLDAADHASERITKIVENMLTTAGF